MAVKLSPVSMVELPFSWVGSRSQSTSVLSVSSGGCEICVAGRVNSRLIMGVLPAI